MSSNTQQTPGDERERMLWKIAKKRVSFRRHLLTYVIINGFLWALWFFDGRQSGHYEEPWPVWPMLGWGIGILFNYIDAFHNNKPDAVEREYEKLKNRNR